MYLMAQSAGLYNSELRRHTCNRSMCMPRKCEV